MTAGEKRNIKFYITQWCREIGIFLLWRDMVQRARPRIVGLEPMPVGVFAHEHFAMREVQRFLKPGAGDTIL